MTIAGQKIKTKRQRLELPPTKNTRDGNEFTHNGWVQEWRTAAKEAASMAHRIPPLGRIRISAVVYRSRIGIADAENDHARLAPLQDGIVDAGVIPKDTYRFCERGDVREERAGADGPGVLLIVEALSPPTAARATDGAGEES
ncbi:MAG TPA: hypothetical protein VMT30_09255 [Candidatus Saccharimonadia bacterium]|nr:hypothetical protein [Candidatus Saccharimonadia bacterium]